MKPPGGGTAAMAVNILMFMVVFFATNTSSYSIYLNPTNSSELNVHQHGSHQITANPVTSFHVQARQATDQWDKYPCWYCEPNTDESPDLGGNTCVQARDEDDICPDDLDEPSLVSNLSIKTEKSGVWTVDGERYEWNYDNYPSCSAAAKKEPVAKWFGFPVYHDESQCPIQVQQLDQSEVVTSLYQADHVYECQTLLQFFQWLRGDFQVVGWPESYQRPSTEWILRVLMGAINDDFTLEPFVWEDQTVWEHTTAELGSYDQTGRLALVQGTINRNKGTFFQGHRPANFPTKESRIGPVKRWQRDVVAVFQYMGDQTIWDIFTETSRAIEDALSYFDVAYDWADEGALGRPDREDGQPTAGLRDVYCYFIDNLLHDIEERAVTWVHYTYETFGDKVEEDPEYPDQKEEWMGEFVNGILTVDKFQFPQVEPDVDDDGVALLSVYSTWDNGPAGPW